MFSRFFSSSSGGSVSGPHTDSPVTRLLAPRSPCPCCTVFTCMSCQFLRKLQMMPPWRLPARELSLHPSPQHIAARGGGFVAAPAPQLVPLDGKAVFVTFSAGPACGPAHH